MGFLKKKKQPVQAMPVAQAKTPDMFETIFNMKFTAKQMGKMAAKSHAAIDVEKKKCLDAIKKGNTEGAKIHAENAVRCQKQEINHLRLQSRLDAVVNKLEGHSKMMQVTQSMGAVTVNLNDAMKNMNIEQISNVMDTFEKQFENLDVQSNFIEGAIGNTMASGAPQAEVNKLLEQIGAEHNLEMSNILDSAVPGPTSAVGASNEVPAAMNLEEMQKRMNNL
mmetsp:Transcript_9981/g.30475  ORF Transcript_9981/g.30475 Transcript_9981/m.30475 type:complete len:222 (+) Transcript_9981:123-788(+)|eukprot:CAMPEP_0198722660 /NCGR_PEP_ID=MMETSP1475-20131203/296_1 /TAXON_ID= ORGANISM="Unidentified sp., Strain CCMP1999" /NCGR_SAMPLE_ID=MMETSP1475 /ASSEMBLY_ACC=CAM_ASM_001111 /LENGTH=221 /DNA_ID=CAMNT_0044483571 /DNA_START=112 /DNA_END=777 /DNA_ORIENTATION=+